MKYALYLSLILFQVVRKIGVLWFFIIVPFRKYARNVVYNYILQNGLFLKRLAERPISVESDKYIINPYHWTNGGYINRRKISKLEYTLVFWIIWIWLDDDANDDTFDYGHVEQLRNESKVYAWLLKDCKSIQYGNSFDLGDARQPSFHKMASFLWTVRNSSMNFKYYFHSRPLYFKHVFYYNIFGYGFGWKKSEEEYQFVYMDRH